VSCNPSIWGSVRRQIESRKAGVQVSRADLANAQLSAQATLATDYFDLRAVGLPLRKLLAQAVSADQRALEIRRISSTPEPRPTAMSGGAGAVQATQAAAHRGGPATKEP